MHLAVVVRLSMQVSLRSQPQPCGHDRADTIKQCEYAEMFRPPRTRPNPWGDKKAGGDSLRILFLHIHIHDDEASKPSKYGQSDIPHLPRSN
jgi:hypothetical protein